MFSVVILGPRAYDKLVPKFRVAIYVPHAALPMVTSKFYSNAALKKSMSKLIRIIGSKTPARLFLQASCFSLQLQLSQTCLYMTDERSLPENLQNRKEKYFLPPLVNVSSFSTALRFLSFLPFSSYPPLSLTVWFSTRSVSVCMCIPPHFIVFHAVPVVSKDSRRIFLPRNSYLFLRKILAVTDTGAYLTTLFSLLSLFKK
jgi:hypothetical protein